jgi:hypothetical protein
MMKVIKGSTSVGVSTDDTDAVKQPRNIGMSKSSLFCLPLVPLTRNVPGA